MSVFEIQFYPADLKVCMYVCIYVYMYGMYVCMYV